MNIFSGINTNRLMLWSAVALASEEIKSKALVSLSPRKDAWTIQ
jgi:hypothetical protein